MSNHLIIIGASARAAAQSAIRAGYSPWCIDLFADRDLQAIAPVKRCPRETWPEGVLELMHDAPPGPVLFTGAMENQIELMRKVEADRPLFCGLADAAARVRSPFAIATAWRKHTDNVPQEALSPHQPGVCLTYDRPPWHARWTWRWRRRAGGPAFLVKPRRGAGGKGVRFWSVTRPCTSDEYVQQFIRGTPVSAVFRVHEGRAVLIGASEQLIGDWEYGGAAFEYCGNIGPMRLTDATKQKWELIGNVVTEWAALEGIFGVDAVLSTEVPNRHQKMGLIYPVEVNPRYTASVELYERAGQASVLTLPWRRAGTPLPLDPQTAGFHGKAILRARRRCRVPDLYDEVEADTIADVPEIGQVIDAGEPVCTVFASGESRAACEDRLRRTAQRVYTRLQPA
jgi:predicted ATP-grasp superfamily ATP-dependent carboligase